MEGSPESRLRGRRYRAVQRGRGLRLTRVRFVPLAGEALGFGALVCGQPRADSVDTLRLIPLPTGSNNKTCQRSGLFLFLSDGTDNLLLILKLQMN